MSNILRTLEGKSRHSGPFNTKISKWLHLKQECIPVGWKPIAVVAATRYQYQEGVLSPPPRHLPRDKSHSWRQIPFPEPYPWIRTTYPFLEADPIGGRNLPRGRSPRTEQNRITDRRLWKHYLPLRSINISFLDLVRSLHFTFEQLSVFCLCKPFTNVTIDNLDWIIIVFNSYQIIRPMTQDINFMSESELVQSWI